MTEPRFTTKPRFSTGQRVIDAQGNRGTVHAILTHKFTGGRHALGYQYQVLTEDGALRGGIPESSLSALGIPESKLFSCEEV